MNIVIIHKASFHQRPPVISSTLILSELGHKVTLCTVGINEYWKKELSNRGIDYYVIPNVKRKIPILSTSISYLRFRIKVGQILKKIKPDIIWVESAYTMVSLGVRLIQKYRYVLQIQELYENSPVSLRVIKKIIGDASAAFMPEYNRTVLYQVWFKLNRRPFVLPNKPYFIPSDESLCKVFEKYEEYRNLFEQKKVILYQGILHKERDLSPFVQAIKKLGGDYALVLLGKDYGMVQKFLKIDPSIIHIDSLPAPDYLAFTMMAHIGIVMYDEKIINTAYCAPNKIFEYSNFGLPMIGNDIPGLRYTIDTYQAGILVDGNTVEDIVEAIKKIDNNYEYYQSGSKKLYESVDNKATIAKVLNSIQFYTD